MTPEESAHQFASKLLALSGLEISPNTLHLAEKYAAQAIREAKIEAYEEAAQIADEIEDSMAEAIAERIRALKDPIV